MNLSIISPCLNECKNLEKFADKVMQTLDSGNLIGELIIVDDNSKDGSDLILEKLKDKYNNFNYYIRKNKPKDLTQSCFDGIELSTYDNIVIMDCDLQHDPEDIKKLLLKYDGKNTNIVVGSRDLYKRNHGLSLLRQFVSLCIIFAINLLLTKKTSDPMSGFFIFNKNIFSKSNNYYGKGFKILIDIIYNSKDKINVQDVIINFNLRSQNTSKMNSNVLFHIVRFVIFNFLKKFK